MDQAKCQVIVASMTANRGAEQAAFVAVPGNMSMIYCTLCGRSSFCPQFVMASLASLVAFLGSGCIAIYSVHGYLESVLCQEYCIFGCA